MTKIAEIFTRKEKTKPGNQNTPNKPSPARRKETPKPVQSAKKRKKKEEEKKSVTQLRGYWTKFAEQQKEKRKKNEEKPVKIPNKTDEKPKSPAFQDQELACSNKSAKSSKIVREGEMLPEHSNLPGKPRIKLKSEMNCSRESRLTGNNGLR